MQIERVTVHNFRSIDHMAVNLGDYSVLVGENNAGKSNIMDALRIFYEKSLKFEPARDAPKFQTADAESWMDIEYALSDDEYANLKDEYKRPNNRLRVRKYLRTEQKDADGKRRQGIHGYTSESDIGDEQFYGAKNVQQGKLGDVVYIEDVSRLSEHTKMSGPSALRDVIDEIVKKLVRSSASFRSLSEHFRGFAATFKSETTPDGLSLAALENEINEEILGWDATFRLDISPPTEGQIVKNLLSHAIQDQALAEEVDAEQFGQGFQRFLIFTLIRLAARYQPVAKTTDRKEFSPDMTLLLFEEPEAFLHPPQQLILCQSLRSIAARPGDQVLASSHSPYFVSQQIDDLPSITRLCREDARTRAGQISKGQLQEIFAENLQINAMLSGTRYEASADDLREDMEAVKYCLWLNPLRCSMFFARHVFLVEGTAEQVLLNYLVDTGRLKSPNGGLYVLDCLGKFNIHRFMNILGPLRVPHSVLFDADGGKAPHQAIKKLIEDTRNDYTRGIGTFPDEIETFLGIQKAKEKHRKPQHLMLNLHHHRISPDKIEALVRKVGALVGT